MTTEQYLDAILDHREQMEEDAEKVWEWVSIFVGTRQVIDDLDLAEHIHCVFGLQDFPRPEQAELIMIKALSFLSLDDLEALGIITDDEVIERYSTDYLESQNQE